jgi:hypothetical protein
MPEDWDDLVLTNNYNIEEIEIPKDAESSRMMRIMAVRKGTLTRTVKCDGKTFKKQYSISV